MAGLADATFSKLLAIIKSEGVRIPVGNTFAIIDADDLPKLDGYVWARQNAPGLCYAVGGPKGARIKMHHLILGAPQEGLVIDHIDGDGLNNQRHNLRFCTHAQNMKNRKGTTGSTSKFKGVFLRRGRWAAQIKSDGVRYALGTFHSQVKAARAYDRAAKQIHGDFARTNVDLNIY